MDIVDISDIWKVKETGQQQESVSWKVNPFIKENAVQLVVQN